MRLVASWLDWISDWSVALTCLLSGPSNLLEQIGIDPHELHWMQLSACHNVPFVLFFEEYEKDKAIAENVDQLCLRCPAIKECYEYGMKTRSTGVFGGFFLLNGEVNKARNSHKTQEVATKLAGKVFHE
jgi:Transcription factor WhiB